MSHFRINRQTKRIFDNIGKPEKSPADMKVKTTTPNDVPFKRWYEGFWGRYSFHMADYTLKARS
jgi:hypothetical protein